MPLEPIPSTTGTRPPTILITSPAKRLRSSKVRWVASPVLPSGEIPSTPASTKRSTTASVAARSTAPPSSNGVTIAGINPVNINRAPPARAAARFLDPTFSYPIPSRKSARTL